MEPHGHFVEFHGTPRSCVGRGQLKFLVKQKTSFLERQQFHPFSVIFEKPI